MMWSFDPVATLVTAPTVEPVTAAEVKLYLRVDTTTDNDLITIMIASARQWAESYTRRAICTQTWDFRYVYFPLARRPLIIPKAPLQSITSVTYIDEDEATQTLASSQYVVRKQAGPSAGRGSVELADDVSLPSVSAAPMRPVTVRAVCGYGVASDVPPGLKMGLLLMLGDLYDQRQMTITGTSVGKNQTTVEHLFAPYRLLESS